MEFSAFEILAKSTFIARIVLAILAIESLIAWAIIINRFYYLMKVKRMNREFSIAFMLTSNLAGFEHENPGELVSPLAALAAYAAAEEKRVAALYTQCRPTGDLITFVDSQISMVNNRFDAVFPELSVRAEKGTVFLAMVSSSAPFFGLLGTVWGIMDAFFQISKQGSANLLVVAPGIAESLIATAFGLVVAIPAVLSYNYFIHEAQKIENQLFAFRGDLLFKLKQSLCTQFLAPDDFTQKPQSQGAR